MFVVIDSLTMRVSTAFVRDLLLGLLEDSMKPIDRFGELLVEHFRDQSLGCLQGMFEGKWKAPDQQLLDTKVLNLSTELKTTVFELVDDVLIRAMHDFLFALQECQDHDMGIEVVVDGKPIAEQSDGLHGEIFGRAGWIVRFSKFPAEKEIAGSLESAKFISEMLKRMPEEESSGQ